MDQDELFREAMTELALFYENNRKYGLIQSRDCCGCGNPDPDPRFFSSACRHAFCGECADNTNACPSCNEPTSFVRMFEDEGQPYVCAICCLDTSGLGVFDACGHMACGICALRLCIEARRADLNFPLCPFCQAESICLPIEEAFVEFERTDQADPVPNIEI